MRRGFTLIELLVVIAIIGLLISIPDAIAASAGFTDEAWTRMRSSLAPLVGIAKSSRNPGGLSRLSMASERMCVLSGPTDSQ